MVTMQNVQVSTKTPIKGELLCKLVTRYPALDLTTVQLISHIQAIGKRISVMINRSLVDQGLTEAKFYVLAFLFSEELLGHSNPSPSLIADHVGITRGTVTGLLDGLEREGFVERFHDIHDRRGLTIRITDKGRVIVDEFLPMITMSLEQVMPLNEAERVNVIDQLARIESALEAIAPGVPECL
jgi:DNA-binding MarR family transcriptional regulator